MTTGEPTDAMDRRAWQLIELRRYQEAMEVARQGLAADAHDAELLAALATAQAELRDILGAIDTSKRLIALRPDDDRGHVLFAHAQSLFGRDAIAVESYERALAIDSTNAMTHARLVEALLRQAPEGRMRRSLANRLIGRAETHASEALKLAPGSPVSHLVMAKVMLARHDHAAAQAHTENALRIRPDHHVGHQLLGIVAESRGDVGAAGDHYVNAARLNPRSTTSTALLRRMRTAAPVGAMVVFLLVRPIIGLARLVGGLAAGVVILVGLSGLVYFLYLRPRWRTDQALSDDAKRALEIDRRVRGRRWRR